MDYKNLAIEQNIWQAGYRFLAGIDEVGRGPLAGPVFACAVIFDPTFYHADVRDSKQLVKGKRESLAEILRNKALDCGIGHASVTEIDEINIRQATFKAMHRALAALTVSPDYLLIDGENLPDAPCPSQGIIRGDVDSFTISAASIIAKVARDKYMQKLDQVYPVYKFAKNKGYGTAEHIDALHTKGPSPYHRKTFLTKILAD